MLFDASLQLMNIIRSPQVQGLAPLMGGSNVIQEAMHEHGIVLAAHGPYTAAGASTFLGCTVDCISQNFSSFAGLVVALEYRFS